MEEEKRPPVHERFKVVVLSLFDVLGDVIDFIESNGVSSPISKGLVLLGKIAYGSKDATELIQKFISRTACNWDGIKKRDKAIIAESLDAMFEDEPAVIDHIPCINALICICLEKDLGEKKGDPKVEEVIDMLTDSIWKILEVCIKQCVTHVHEMRDPQIVVTKSGDGSVTEKVSYNKKYFPDLSVKKLCEIWGVKV